MKAQDLKTAQDTERTDGGTAINSRVTKPGSKGAAIMKHITGM